MQLNKIKHLRWLYEIRVVLGADFLKGGYMKVFIAGLTGTGKSTIAESVANKLKLKYFRSSMLFREFAGKDTKTIGWWEKEGLNFIKERADSDIDEKFDKYLLDLADREENFVIDSWTLPWLYKEQGLKILLTCPADVRVNRVMTRDSISLDAAKKSVAEKDHKTRLLFLQKYAFDITKELNVFDLIINTQYLSKDDEIKLICEYAKKYKEFFE